MCRAQPGARGGSNAALENGAEQQQTQGAVRVSVMPKPCEETKMFSSTEARLAPRSGVPESDAPLWCVPGELSMRMTHKNVAI